MDDLLYLTPDHKKYFQGKIQSLTRVFIDKLFPTFINIQEEAEEHSENLFDSICQSVGGENSDPSDAAEYAMDEGVEYYQALSLAKYGFTAFSISLLYHFWEQQIKYYLFNELRKNRYRIDFKDFSKIIYNINNIKNLLLEHDVDIEKFDSWDKLNELRLLNNAVKHGSTDNFLRLKNKNSTLFHSWIIEDDETITRLDSCILEEILDISEANFKEYSDVLMQFWEEFPERNYHIL